MSFVSFFLNHTGNRHMFDSVGMEFLHVRVAESIRFSMVFCAFQFFKLNQHESKYWIIYFLRIWNCQRQATMNQVSQKLVRQSVLLPEFGCFRCCEFHYQIYRNKFTCADCWSVCVWNNKMLGSAQKSEWVDSNRCGFAKPIKLHQLFRRRRLSPLSSPENSVWF